MDINICTTMIEFLDKVLRNTNENSILGTHSNVSARFGTFSLACGGLENSKKPYFLNVDRRSRSSVETQR